MAGSRRRAVTRNPGPAPHGASMLSYRPNELLVVFAVATEAQGLFEPLGVPLLYSGVGKLNAAYALTRRLAGGHPKLVVSFGTAGSTRYPAHTLLECTRFVQRDMDATALGFAPGQTPFDALGGALEVPKRLARLRAATCGSGDQFVGDAAAAGCDVLDMEGYALAKVCRREAVEFLAVKYVTDAADGAAAADWAGNLRAAAAAFVSLYRELVDARP